MSEFIQPKTEKEMHRYLFSICEDFNSRQEMKKWIAKKGVKESFKEVYHIYEDNINEISLAKMIENTKMEIKVKELELEILEYDLKTQGY